MEALHNGWWILLDEVNLATAETLQCLSSLLESQHGSFLLPERGYSECIVVVCVWLQYCHTNCIALCCNVTVNFFSIAQP